MQTQELAGVFDFLAFSYDRGTVVVGGYSDALGLKKDGRVVLLGAVDNESDKAVAGLRAREVPGPLDCWLEYGRYPV